MVNTSRPRVHPTPAATGTSPSSGRGSSCSRADACGHSTDARGRRTCSRRISPSAPSIDTRHRQRGKPVRKSVALSLVQVGFLAACGGGGYMTTPPPPTQTIAPPGPPNVETVTVDAGPPGLTFASINTPFVSVQVCVAGTSTCKTIDHIEVDTGSVGLRILSSVLTAAPAITLAAETDSGGDPPPPSPQFAAAPSPGPAPP